MTEAQVGWSTQLKANVLVIDDDPKITRMLERALTHQGFEVTTAGDGQSGLALVDCVLPDVVILDVMMPGVDGIEVCRRLRRRGDIPVLMLTARDAVADRVRGLQCGADDYLVKPFALEELLARVQALLRRRECQSYDVLRFSDLTVHTATRKAARCGRVVDLSMTEFELLALLMRRPGQVLTRDVIMERVWGYDFEGESNVLEVYVSYLRAKIEAPGEARLIHTIRGVGYAMRE